MSKLALITGGSGYLGGAVAACFKERGYVSVSLSRESGCDITQEASVKDAVERAVAAHGPVFACVHAAAPKLIRKPLLSIEPTSFNQEIMIAARGAYLLARAVLPHMAKDMVFVGITTETIEKGEPISPSGAYVPSKYALRGVLRALVPELPRVYAFSPGFLPGGLNGDMPEAVREMLARKYESQTPQEVAALVVGLCDESSVPSGTSVRADGTHEPL